MVTKKELVRTDYAQAHAAWLQDHLARRKGERRGRLERGHQEAERLFCQQVWWPMMGSFEQLQPEYEVLDWRGIPYYCDFVWMTPTLRLAIEIKGFGPHVRDMDRQRYSNELNRETYLSALGFQVVCFSYDDVSSRPDLCSMLLRMLISRYQSAAQPAPLEESALRETVRLAGRLARPLRPADLRAHLGLDYRTAVKLLRTLCNKGWFTPQSGPSGRYVTRYQLQPHAFLAGGLI